MKTTIELPDELFQEAKATAARRRITLKSMIEHALRRELGGYENADPGGGAYEIDADGLPVIRKSTDQALTSEMVYGMMDELGI